MRQAAARVLLTRGSVDDVFVYYMIFSKFAIPPCCRRRLMLRGTLTAGRVQKAQARTSTYQCPGSSPTRIAAFFCRPRTKVTTPSKSPLSTYPLSSG